MGKDEQLGSSNCIMKNKRPGSEGTPVILCLRSKGLCHLPTPSASITRREGLYLRGHHILGASHVLLQLL